MIEKYLEKSEFDSYEDFYNNFKLTIPANFNFAYDVVDGWAASDPDKTALVWCNEEGEEASFTFAQIRDESNRTANYLKSLGIGKGDAVMLILKRHYEFWFTVIALHKIGAVAIPATHLLRTKDLVYRNNAAGVKAIMAVNEKEILESVDESLADSPTLKTRIVVKGSREGWSSYSEDMGNCSPEFSRPGDFREISPADLSLIYFTSGTTGQPKMVSHNFDYPLGHIITAHFWQNVQDGGLHLTVSDTGWAKAVWGKLYGQWICGSAVFVYDFDKFDATNMLDVISRHGVTSFCAPPTVYRFLIKEDLKSYDLTSLKYCTVAGEPLNPEVYSQFLEGTGIALKEAYGQTELVVTVGTFPWMETKPGSMGKPSPSYDVVILDEDMNVCPDGEVGQIALRLERGNPYGMFQGYHLDRELTDSVWHDGYYFTGDTAWKDEEGYFWFVGRADDIIKSSGYRIGPFEVESALLEHEAVLECAVTAVPDPDRGQVVKGSIILAKGFHASEALARELQDHVKQITAPYKYPRIVEFVEELPKTISGKIRRVAIRQS